MLHGLRLAVIQSSGYVRVDTHCYICKQPKTQEEVVRILSAMSIQDLDCIQYKGKDRNILKSLRENGMESCISSNIQIFIANLKRKLGFK